MPSFEVSIHAAASPLAAIAGAKPDPFRDREAAFEIRVAGNTLSGDPLRDGFEAIVAALEEAAAEARAALERSGAST